MIFETQRRQPLQTVTSLLWVSPYQWKLEFFVRDLRKKRKLKYSEYKFNQWTIRNDDGCLCAFHMRSLVQLYQQAKT